MTRIILEFIVPCYEEAGLLWVHGVHGKVGENQEVVRCRDCRFAEPDNGERKQFAGTFWCALLTEGLGHNVLPDDFCAWGERNG